LLLAELFGEHEARGHRLRHLRQPPQEAIARPRITHRAPWNVRAEERQVSYDTLKSQPWPLQLRDLRAPSRAARRVRNSHIAIRPRSMARNFTVIGPMRAKSAQSKLSARREESVASLRSEYEEVVEAVLKGSKKIWTPCARAMRRSSTRSAQ
jgi:hypothetical protein